MNSLLHFLMSQTGYIYFNQIICFNRFRGFLTLEDDLFSKVWSFFITEPDFMSNLVTWDVVILILIILKHMSGNVTLNMI